MAYFNHAFSKAFLVDALAADDTASSALVAQEFGTFQRSDWTSMADPNNAGTGLQAGDLMYLIQGSIVTTDTIGNNPGHGGYSESVKSKGINPRYITRLWSSSCETATAATVTVAVACDCAPCGQNLFLRIDVKGSPALRFLNHNAYAIGDSSGDAAANGGALPGVCCTATQTHLDPAVALAAAAQMLLADPIVTPFIQEASAGGISISKTSGGPGAGGLDAVSVLGALVPGTLYVADNGTTTGTAVNVATTNASGTGSGLTLDITITAGIVQPGPTINCPGSGYTATNIVTIVGGASDATVVITTVVPTATYTITQVINGGYTPSLDPCTDGVTATVTFEGAYVDTQFGNCSFDTRDHYEMEPVQLIASILDETGNPCVSCGVVTSTAGTMKQTSGETVIRDVLLTEAYRQSPFNQGNKDSPRMQQIEHTDHITGAVDRLATYKVYYLQHSIPRLNNPTGVFDNDQYVYKVYVLCSGAPLIDALDTLWGNIATLAQDHYGNQVIFESSVDNV